MPLQKLTLKPGINRENTSLTGKGGWYDCDNVRFRAGFPEKIGGWAALTYTPFLGVCRSLWNWITLKQYNLLGIGTNLKFYVEDGGTYYDITPIRVTTLNTTTFSANTTTPSSIITVVDSSVSNIQVDDFVTFSNAVSLGGNITADILNQEYQIATVISGTSYTILARAVSPVATPGAAVLSNSSDVGDGGGATDSAYQISTGLSTYTVGTGWGTGGWSRGAWGSGFTSGLGLQLREWNQSNYGEDLLFSPRSGPLYIWQPGSGASPSFTARGTLISGTDVPSKINFFAVSDATRIVIAFGCDDYGLYNANVLDPMLIRWTAQEDYLDWTPTATNQAGSYRLSHGSEIIGALQTRQEILVVTDAAIYSMQYLGPPYVWGFTLLADNISIASSKSIATASGITYWMGVDKFYYYGGRVDTLPCSVRKFVFDNVNIDQSNQFFAGTNEGYSEVWWFYCSASSDEIDRYVIFNYAEKAWYYGAMSRTAWLDSALRTYPQAATSGNIIVFHEAAVDNGETNPPTAITSYIQSSDFDIGEGDRYAFVTKMIPDVTFNASTTPLPNRPSLTFTMRPRVNPGAPYGATNSPSVTAAELYNVQHAYNVQEFTEIVYTRVRGRQMAFRVDCNSLGTQWQLGTPSIEMRIDGRR